MDNGFSGWLSRHGGNGNVEYGQLFTVAQKELQRPPSGSNRRIEYPWPPLRDTSRSGARTRSPFGENSGEIRGRRGTHLEGEKKGMDKPSDRESRAPKRERKERKRDDAGEEKLRGGREDEKAPIPKVTFPHTALRTKPVPIDTPRFQLARITTAGWICPDETETGLQLHANQSVLFVDMPKLYPCFRFVLLLHHLYSICNSRRTRSDLFESYTPRSDPRCDE